MAAHLPFLIAQTVKRHLPLVRSACRFQLLETAGGILHLARCLVQLLLPICPLSQPLLTDPPGHAPGQLLGLPEQVLLLAAELLQVAFFLLCFHLLIAPAEVLLAPIQALLTTGELPQLLKGVLGLSCLMRTTACWGHLIAIL